MKNNSWRDRIVLIIVVAVMLLIFYHCPFRMIIGVPCPGCGMTRALMSAVMLDFSQAFAYHPLWPIVLVIVVIWYLHSTEAIRLNRTQIITVQILLSALFIIVYLLRLISGDDVVSWNIDQSVLGRLLGK